MFKKSLTLILCSSLLLLLGCDFRPRHKVIEYQEEVKLSDGSFIWVDIKRHYTWSGWAPGGGSGAYMPGIVEISWDTGFPNVGRKSVFFARQVFLIDKIDNVWFVAGVKNNNEKIISSNSINCNKLGFFVGNNGCIVALDKTGNFVKKQPTILDGYKMNILYSIGIKDWGTLPEPLANTKISWNHALTLQQTQTKSNQYIGKQW